MYGNFLNCNSYLYVMFSKKGQVTEQFNWVFAIIAGSIILLFFLFVIGQIKVSSDAKLAVTVLNNFDAILTGSSVTANSLNVIDSSKLLAFDISCEKDGFSELTLVGSNSRISLNQRLLYSPLTTSGQRFYLYVAPVERPFNLGNAMLLTGDNVLFAIYNTDSSEGLNDIYSLFPENISAELVTMFTNNHKSYDKIVVLSDSRAPDFSNSYDSVHGEGILRKKNVMWIDLDFVGTRATVANVYEKEAKDKLLKPSGKVDLFSNEFALFLSFSKSLDFYKCNFNKINSKMRVVAKIYLERALMLSDTVTKAGCASKYRDAIDVLEEMIKSSSSYSESDLVDSLTEINHGLLLNSCPLVY